MWEKFWRKKNSYGLDLNHIGKIHEYVAHSVNDETTKGTSRALKMVYFCQSSFERGSCFKTFQGSFPKLEFKSPTTMILLGLLYFLNCDHLRLCLFVIEFKSVHLENFHIDPIV